MRYDMTDVPLYMCTFSSPLTRMALYDRLPADRRFPSNTERIMLGLLLGPKINHEHKCNSVLVWSANRADFNNSNLPL